ncbi:MAG: hypothetical protein GXX10_09710 [Clostridiaceae bacterium]|nr:hypothetical protein [Clostridiaceae bacterium]
METNQVEKIHIIPLPKSLCKRRLAAIIISAFIALFLIFILFSFMLNNTTVHHGVKIDGKNVGGYTKNELSRYLADYYQQNFSNIALTIKSPSFTRNISLSDLGIKIDIEDMVQKAFAMGRTGNLFQRLYEGLRLIISPVTIELSVDVSSDAFTNYIDRICNDVFREVTPPNLIILEDKVILCTGVSGQEADREKLEKDIIKAIKAMKPAEIDIAIKEKLPPSLDFDTTFNTLNKEPVDAQFIKTSRTTYEIKPHEMGRRIDRDKLMEILNYVENRQTQEYEEIILPVEFINPQLTDEELNSRLFRDTLASYRTYFRTDTENNINRSINIELAAKSIDGTILLPGEEFSFNKIVGPRTPQKGYKTAHIFVEGQIRDGTGGGVCQVSTTLYNAVLRSNLEVLERHNHMFTVGYVPLGLDAAVSYGYADLVFRNNTGHPMIIKAKVSNNTLDIKIVSTNDYPGLKVKLATKTISSTPRTVQFIDDPSLPAGTAIVAESGMDGYIVDTYIKVYNGDVLIREEKLHRSVYQMLPRKVIRGTGRVSEVIE